MSRSSAGSSLAVLLATWLLSGCSSRGEGPHRARLEPTGPSAVNLLATPGQLPYCLVFSASDRGVVRQLTKPPDNKAVRCDEGQPIGGAPFAIPPSEGHVRLFVVFADEALDAGPIAPQMRALAVKRSRISGMDLRAPGKVAVEMLSFTPR